MNQTLRKGGKFHYLFANPNLIRDIVLQESDVSLWEFTDDGIMINTDLIPSMNDLYPLAERKNTKKSQYIILKQTNFDNFVLLLENGPIRLNYNYRSDQNRLLHFKSYITESMYQYGSFDYFKHPKLPIKCLNLKTGTQKIAT